MKDHAIFDKIDLHLIRVLHTVLTERSVSRAAIRLGMHQPAVSASLKRLRDFAQLAMQSGRHDMANTTMAFMAGLERMKDDRPDVLRRASS